MFGSFAKKKGGKVFDKGDPSKLYSLEECLGEGTYGTVWTGTQLSSGRKCAVKIVTIDDDLEEIEQEIKIMKDANSHYIVKFFGAYWGKDEKVWMVMEHCIAGSLNDLMYVTDCTLNAKQIKVIMAAMALGLEYLHNMGIIHRDIKAGNVLLSGEGHIRLADFGVSAVLKSKTARTNTAIGAPFWMAPEVIGEQMYDGRADIWSLGITAIELAEARPPNSHINPMKALFIIPQQDPPTLKNPQDYPKQMNEFIATCLNKNMEARPTATAIKGHPFIKNEVNNLNFNEGMSDVMRKLVNKSLAKIQKWRADESDDDDEDGEFESEYENGSEFSDDEEEGDDEEDEQVQIRVPRPGQPHPGHKSMRERPTLSVPTPFAQSSGNAESDKHMSMHLNPFADASKRMSRVQNRQSANLKPLRDIYDPNRAGNRNTVLNKQQQKDMSISDITNMMDSSADDAMAGVMTPEFISLIKQIYNQYPELFQGKDASEWTGEDVTLAVVGAFTKVVEKEIGGTLEPRYV